MVKIQIPRNEEVILALKAAKTGEELTDRELWIVSEFGGDF